MADAPARLALLEAIKGALQKIYELEATVTDFNGDHELLHERINALLAELGRLQSQRDGAAFEVPVELLSFVDGGGNPDTFTADVFNSSLAANQAAKGKVLAIRSLHDELLKQAATAYPEATAAYKALNGAAPKTEEGQQTA